jgi:hypothetical protein
MPPVYLETKKINRMLLNLLRRPNEERVIHMNGLVYKRTKAGGQNEADHDAGML